VTVESIGKDAITPRFVLEKVHECADELKDLFVVSFPKEGGNRIWVAGDLSNAALAALLLQHIAMSACLGAVDDERG
jgi:hypothetical protein